MLKQRFLSVGAPAAASAAILAVLSAAPASAHYYIPPLSVPVGTCSIDEYGGYVDLGGFGIVPTVVVQPPTINDGFDPSHCVL